MKMSPLSAPFSWGTQGEWLLLPKRVAALWEGTQWCKGGTGKAEAAKLPGAGIGPKLCPGKCAAEKGWPAELGRSVWYRPSYVSTQSGTEKISRVSRTGSNIPHFGHMPE